VFIRGSKWLCGVGGFAHGLTPAPSAANVRGMRIRLTRTVTFEAAHSLPNVPPDHQCARVHGHSYRVDVTCEGEMNPELGWLCDHAVIGAAAKAVAGELDHRYLNDIPGLENPTFENVAVWLWTRLKPQLPFLSEIAIQETSTARCVYQGE
jgi:6-pyruvoyltetrahydropterin/6-carboxytetrahydropterin synthase